MALYWYCKKCGNKNQILGHTKMICRKCKDSLTIVIDQQEAYRKMIEEDRLEEKRERIRRQNARPE